MSLYYLSNFTFIAKNPYLKRNHPRRASIQPTFGRETKRCGCLTDKRYRESIYCTAKNLQEVSKDFGNPPSCGVQWRENITSLMSGGVDRSHNHLQLEIGATQSIHGQKTQ